MKETCSYCGWPMPCDYCANRSTRSQQPSFPGDVVEECRARAPQFKVLVYGSDLLTRAADEIERLRTMLTSTVDVMRRSESGFVTEDEWDTVLNSYDEAFRG
jgi:hypothetical protein